jgi:phage I-like protein
MPSWLNRKDPDEEREIEIKPEDFKKLSESSEKQTAELKELKDKLAGLDAVTAYIQEQKEEKAAAIEAAKEAKRAKEERAEAENKDWSNDPEAAFRHSMKPVVKELFEQRAINVKRDVLGEGHEYYTGDIKTKVDSLIAVQPIEQQSNPNIIENCYKVVIADHMKDILDGKMKSRFAAASGSGSNGSRTESTEAEAAKLSEDEKLAARRFGISEVDYAKAKQEVEYV